MDELAMSRGEAVSSTKNAMTGGKWELQSLNVKPAENGFTVTCEKRKKAKNGYDYKSKDYVFENVESTLTHIESVLKGEDPKAADYESREED